MSKLSDWQAAIEEYDNGRQQGKARVANPSWQTIARQALKIALAAEAYCTPPFDSKNTLPALIDALKEIQS